MIDAFVVLKGMEMPKCGPSFPVLAQKYVEIKYLLQRHLLNHIPNTCWAGKYSNFQKSFYAPLQASNKKSA